MGEVTNTFAQEMLETPFLTEGLQIVGLMVIPEVRTVQMKEIRIEKLTLNIGAGKDVAKLDKGLLLMEQLTGKKPTKTTTDKRIATWGLRPGLPIGCKLTLRGKAAVELLNRLLYAKDGKLLEKQFDNHGNISFGIPEYIDIKDAKYIPEIGIMGLEAAITLGRPGFRVKRKSIKPSVIGKRHKIKKAEAIDFMKSQFKVVIEEA